MINKILMLILVIGSVSGCTTGKLHYTDASGKRVLGCDVEFVGLPSVDKYAVEYALSLCARGLVKKGYSIDTQKQFLLTKDLSIPQPACGQSWNHDAAKSRYKSGALSDKEYGYIVAHIDLGLAATNTCSEAVD